MSVLLALAAFIASVIAYCVQVTNEPVRQLPTGLAFAAMLITAVIAGNLMTGGQ